LQEEVDNRTVTLMISTTKLTSKVLEKAVEKYLNHRKAKKADKSHSKPCGKQTLKELIKQNAGVSNIEITEDNIKGFDRVARKYGVDYAVKKVVPDDKTEPIKFLVFFKARDADALTQAFDEFVKKKQKDKNKTSVLDKLKKLKIPKLHKKKEKELEKEKGPEL
jgi:hypothetical protein